MLGLGWVNADDESSGDEVALLLEFEEFVELHQGPPLYRVKGHLVKVARPSGSC